MRNQEEELRLREKDSTPHNQNQNPSKPKCDIEWLRKMEYHKTLINRRVLLLLSTTKCDSGRLGTGSKTGSVFTPPQWADRPPGSRYWGVPRWLEKSQKPNQLPEVAINRKLFESILQRIDHLRILPGTGYQSTRGKSSVPIWARKSLLKKSQLLTSLFINGFWLIGS